MPMTFHFLISIVTFVNIDPKISFDCINIVDFCVSAISHLVCDRFATWHMCMRQICKWQVPILQWHFQLSESILSVKSEILMRGALRKHIVHRQFVDGWVHVAQKRKLFTFSFASIPYQNVLNHIQWQTSYATEQWQFNYAIIYLPFDVVKPGWLAEREGGRREQARIFDNPLNRRRS